MGANAMAVIRPRVRELEQAKSGFVTFKLRKDEAAWVQVSVEGLVNFVWPFQHAPPPDWGEVVTREVARYVTVKRPLADLDGLVRVVDTIFRTLRSLPDDYVPDAAYQADQTTVATPELKQ